MRTEFEVLSELLEWSADDENIRAIILNGSRGDPSRVPDEFSDYDTAVIVADTSPIREGEWITRFGSPMVQWPLFPQPTFSDRWITQLVLYEDGVRIDFQFSDPDVKAHESSGPYHCVLLDRDDLTRSVERVPVEGTTIELPPEEEFVDRINAFWWDIPYVAKALRRGEIDYARFVMEGDLRWNKLHPLMRWHVATLHGTHTDVGIFGRWFPRFVEPEIWQRYLATFSGADAGDQWRAMFAMAELVRILGSSLARAHGFTYPEDVDRKVTAYLRKHRP